MSASIFSHNICCKNWFVALWCLLTLKTWFCFDGQNHVEQTPTLWHLCPCDTLSSAVLFSCFLSSVYFRRWFNLLHSCHRPELFMALSLWTFPMCFSILTFFHGLWQRWLVDLTQQTLHWSQERFFLVYVVLAKKSHCSQVNHVSQP